MTTFPSPKKNQTKSASKLFSGVSAAALILGVSAVTARAAGTTITNTITSFSVTSGGSLDFIDIDGGTITGDLTNNGTVGLTTNAIAINVRNGGSVGGQVLNATSALIQASLSGIAFQSPSASAVLSVINNGTINISGDTPTPTTFGTRGTIVGVNVNGNSASSTIVNNGTISVKGSILSSAPTTFSPTISAIGIRNNSQNNSINNSGLIDVNLNVTATASGAPGIAFGNGIIAGGPNSSVVNSGEINVSVSNTSPGFGALASGIFQGYFPFNATTSDVSLSAVNSNLISLSAFATGSVNGATIRGITQRVSGFNSDSGNNSLLITNSGTLNLTGRGVGNSGGGTVFRQDLGFFGGSNGLNLDAQIFNTGLATFSASGSTGAFGVGANQGLILSTSSTATQGDLLFNNTGSLDMFVQAGAPFSTASIRGIRQGGFFSSNSSMGDINFIFNNEGLINLSASGTGRMGSAQVFGVSQINVLDNSNLGNVNFSINNSGTLNLSAKGTAVGTDVQFYSALAIGAIQSAMATTSGTINLSANNTTSGNLSVFASANAVGTSSAIGAKATATAIGVQQVNNSASQPNAAFNFSNSGSMNVSGNANASGGVTSNTATALAAGYAASAGGANQTLTLNVGNSGTLNVKATANATNAVATATGLFFNGAVLTGSVSNAGTVSVTASAPSGSAEAVGFAFNADRNRVSFTNTGNINVLAAGSTTATGVKFAGSEDFTNTLTKGTGGTAATFTNNGGTISAWVNNGGTLSHGNAINTVDAPNPVMINLEGGGAITGNILISDDDDILVRNGSTFFDGTVNHSTAFVGDFSIGNGGTLTMQVGVVSSEANIYVDTFTQTSTGTLSFNITPATIKLGMIHANVANLNGTVNVNIAPGFYTNTTFSDVVSAGTLNGTWSSVTTNTNSAFLSLAAQFPGDGTADLVLTRNAFNSLGGLTMNQLAASTGIENSYNVNLTGAYGTLVQDLLFMNAANYTAAVEQLHGAEHAQNMNTLLYSFNSLNYAISDRVNIGPYGTRGGNDIIKRGDLSFWARGSIGSGDNDGDAEASGFDQDINAYHAGFDFAVSDNAILGFAAGYYKNELEFDNGNHKEDDGIQLAIYGHYDIRDYYLRGVIGYGIYDAESRRSISVANTVGTATGLYDVNVFSLHGEFGRRFEVNPNVFVTPYGAFDYAKVSMDGFTETGASGANLSFPDNDISAWMVDFGARFSTAVDIGNGGLFIPEFSVAWQHDFSDNRVALNTSFAGGANSNFTVVGSHVSSNSILVNAGLTFATAGGFEIKGEYNGRFNSEYKENSVAVRLTYQFGK